MSDNRIRVGRATDADRFLATDQLVWFQEVLPAPAEQQLVGLAPEHRFAAEVNDDDEVDPRTYPGVYGVFPMTLHLPGGESTVRSAPCAGLTWVGVHPDHRRRGVLTAMLRHHFEQVHAEPGLHLSALHASEPAIYGRHGYGLASLELRVELGRRAGLTAPGLEGAAATVTTRFATVSDPDMPERMRDAHVRSAQLGAVVGDLGYYERLCAELPEQMRDKESWRLLFARRDGVDIGFAFFRREHRWTNHRPGGELTVWAVTGDAVTRLVLLRRLVDFDLMSTAKVMRTGVDDPLLLWAGGPRSTSDVGISDSLWVRLVDLPDALRQRAYSGPCDVVVEVDDSGAPWNQGRWRIHVAKGQATVERSGADADLRLPVQALGAAYLGGGNLVALHQAGLVAEQRPGAVAELWRAMRTEVAPGAAFSF